MLGLTFKQANAILDRIEHIDDAIGAAQFAFLALGGTGALSYGVIWAARRALIRYGKKEAAFW